MASLMLIGKRDRYLVDSKQKTLHTQDGFLDISKAKIGKPLKTNLGIEYFVLKPSKLDLLLHSKRGPAVVLPKDFGAIVSYTGIDKESLCVDAGSGSGWLALQLARVCKKVVTYENRPEHAKVARANIKASGMKNVLLKEKDVTKGFEEKDVDLITLDMLNPEKVPFSKSLKLGGYTVAYLPHIEQVKRFAKSLGSDAIIERILDVRVDEYFENGKLNKKNKIKHTAYLVFVRKVKK